MIEIRTARLGEAPRQKELWKLAFGDEDAYIDYFYQRRDPERDTLVLLEDGALSTMAALFPVTVALPDGSTASSAYIYALATHPGARKKGFGRFILNYVDFYLKEKGLDCVTIVPAEASLHRFFASVGFSECFSTRKVELLRYMAGSAREGDLLEPAQPADYNRVREKLLAESLHVSYGDDILAYQRGLGRMAGGDLYLLRLGEEEGCLAAEYDDDGDTVLGKELVAPPALLSAAAALVAKELPAVRYHLRTPPYPEGLPGSYLQSFAMIKWYRPELEEAWGRQTKGYMGLGFD